MSALFAVTVSMKLNLQCEPAASRLRRNANETIQETSSEAELYQPLLTSSILLRHQSAHMRD